MSTPPPISWRRKLIYSSIMLAFTLTLVELGLGAVPYIWARMQWTPPPEGAQTWLVFVGDSVTAGFGLTDKAYAYPGVIRDDLVSRGATSYGVYSMARDGSDSAMVTTQVRDALNVTPNGVKPVVLAMVGHNDLTRWAQSSSVDMSSGERQGPQNSGGGLRLFRLFRWFESAVREDVPVSAALSAWETDFVDTLGKLKKRVEVAGGRFMLMTYLVPGPAEGMDRRTTLVLEATRRVQLDVNDAIRRAAKEIQVEVVDVATSDEPLRYDSDVFLDNIHLTLEGHRRVGRFVRNRLAITGVLPASMFRAPMAFER